MRQQQLFDNSPIPTARARQSDPISSHMAAQIVESCGAADTQRANVLEYVREHPGQTSAEIAAGMGEQRHMPARRLPELRTAQLVRNGDVRMCAVSRRNGLTWWIVEATR